MNISYPDYNILISTKEGTNTVICIENPVAYADVVGNIYHQMNGEDGDMIWSQDGKGINISKKGVVVFNPYSISPNEKRVINKLYQELEEKARDYIQEDSALLESAIVTYLDKLIEEVPYGISYDFVPGISALLKMYDVRIDECADSLLERIIEYIKALHRICGIQVFVFVGLKNYISSDDNKQLYEFVSYEKIDLILVESKQRALISSERYLIVDESLCTIELE